MNWEQLFIEMQSIFGIGPHNTFDDPGIGPKWRLAFSPTSNILFLTMSQVSKYLQAELQHLFRLMVRTEGITFAPIDSHQRGSRPGRLEALFGTLTNPWRHEPSLSNLHFGLWTALVQSNIFRKETETSGGRKRIRLTNPNPNLLECGLPDQERYHTVTGEMQRRVREMERRPQRKHMRGFLPTDSEEARQFVLGDGACQLPRLQ